MCVTMLCNNRNLRSLSTAAKTVAILTNGTMYLSAATYPAIGLRKVPLRPTWIVGFATALGIEPGDLAAITGFEVPEELLRVHPLASEMAELIWNVRRLSAAQAEHVHVEAKALLVPVPNDASPNEWNRVYHQYKVWWGAPRTPGE
jgi:hypothetical protein